MTRTLLAYLKEHPEFFNKMVLIAGSRQVGKTTLLLEFPKILKTKNSSYLNWDNENDREFIVHKKTGELVGRMLALKNPVLLLDEIHKYPRWKNYLKGLFDTYKNNLHMMITGSSRLDYHRKGGDSLLGRYWFFQLNPFTLAEYLKKHSFNPPSQISMEQAGDKAYQAFDKLMERGGFPEPLFKLTDDQVFRWRSLRKEALVKGDLRDLTRIQELTGIKLLMDLLPQKIGSPLSFNSLREDIEVNHATLMNWIGWLKIIYYCYTISPYTAKMERSLKKAPKLYLYDWSDIEAPGARFENFVAGHLKTLCDFYTEIGKGEWALFYLRDKEGHEVDFLVTKNKKPWLLCEAKAGEAEITKGFSYYLEKIPVEHAVIVSAKKTIPSLRIHKNKKIWLGDAASLFQQLV